MSDTLITVVAIVLIGGLLFVIPLTTTADKLDTTSQAQVEAITYEFVEEIVTTKEITEERYNQFLENLTATGYTFDVNMEVSILDENPGKKTSQTATDKIGENVYYTQYTPQIEEELEKNGVKELKSGDIVLVEVENNNIPLSQQLKNWIYKIVGNDNATIVASKAGMVQ